MPKGAAFSPFRTANQISICVPSSITRFVGRLKELCISQPNSFSLHTAMPRRVLTHAHLLRAAWGPAQENQTEYLRVAVRALRQKLENEAGAPRLIVNEPGIGYRLAS